MAQPSEGGIPNSVVSPLGSRIGADENRMPHPLGSSEEKGIPEPPPVVAPTILTAGRVRIIETRLFAAE